MNFINILERRLGKISEEKVSEKTFLKNELERIFNKIQELDVQEGVLQKEASKERITREIYISDTLNRNVNIDISGLGYHCEKAINGVKVFRFKQEIIIESLLEMENQEYDIFIPEN